jgi:hypothetical protein
VGDRQSRAGPERVEVGRERAVAPDVGALAGWSHHEQVVHVHLVEE